MLCGSNASLILRLHHIQTTVNDYIKKLYNCTTMFGFRCYNAFTSRGFLLGIWIYIYIYLRILMMDFSGCNESVLNTKRQKWVEICARANSHFTHISPINNHTICILRLSVRPISQWLINDDNKNCNSGVYIFIYFRYVCMCFYSPARG